MRGGKGGGEGKGGIEREGGREGGGCEKICGGRKEGPIATYLLIPVEDCLPSQMHVLHQVPYLQGLPSLLCVSGEVHPYCTYTEYTYGGHCGFSSRCC